MSANLLKAIHFAAQKHQNQRRKNTAQTPYIGHPIEAAHLLAEGGVTNTEILQAAVLHDTLEDTNTTFEELEANFGKEVATTVRECTDNKKLNKIHRKMMQLVHADTLSYSAQLVKAADKLSNLSNLVSDPPAHWTKSEILGYAVWSWFVVQGLKSASPLCPQIFEKLDQVFQKLGVLDLQGSKTRELEIYYQNINQSE